MDMDSIDCEMNNLGENIQDTFDEDESIEVYPVTKRFKTRFLTYLRVNYFKIFWIMSILLVSLLILFGLLIALFVTKPSFTNADVNVFENNNYGPSRYPKYLTTGKSSSSTVTPEIKAKPCQKINCNTIKEPCRPSEINYLNIKRYSCCKCIKLNMTLYRYEESLMNDGKMLIIKDYPYGDICSLSLADLDLLGGLDCIEGSWDVVKESDITCYLRYDIVGGCPPQDE